MSLNDAFGFDLDQLGLVMLLDIFEETAIYTYEREYSIKMEEGKVKAWFGKKLKHQTKEIKGFECVEAALVHAIREHIKRSERNN
jgi:hypothetical protein